MMSDQEPEVEEEHQEVDPAPTPDHDPADPHRGPLDDDHDYAFLDNDDPRRQPAEQRLSRRGD